MSLVKHTKAICRHKREYKQISLEIHCNEIVHRFKMLKKMTNILNYFKLYIRIIKGMKDSTDN